MCAGLSYSAGPREIKFAAELMQDRNNAVERNKRADLKSALNLRSPRSLTYSMTPNVYIFPEDEMLCDETPGGRNPYSPFFRPVSLTRQVRLAIFSGVNSAAFFSAPPEA